MLNSSIFAASRYVKLFTYFGLWIAEIFQFIFNSIEIGNLETKTTFNRIAIYLNPIAFFMTSYFNPTTIQRNHNHSEKILFNPQSNMDAWENKCSNGFQFFIRSGGCVGTNRVFRYCVKSSVPYFNCPRIIIHNMWIEC